MKGIMPRDTGSNWKNLIEPIVLGKRWDRKVKQKSTILELEFIYFKQPNKKTELNKFLSNDGNR